MMDEKIKVIKLEEFLKDIKKHAIMLVIMFVIPFSVGSYFFWNYFPSEQLNHNVNKNSCTCDCFDRVTKGRYFLEHKREFFFFNYLI